MLALFYEKLLVKIITKFNFCKQRHFLNKESLLHIVVLLCSIKITSNFENLTWFRCWAKRLALLQKFEYYPKFFCIRFVKQLYHVKKVQKLTPKNLSKTVRFCKYLLKNKKKKNFSSLEGYWRPTFLDIMCLIVNEKYVYIIWYKLFYVFSKRTCKTNLTSTCRKNQ